MRRKVRNRKGFTLAETLIVVLILALLTSAGSVGISAVMASRVGMVQTADAQILGSTAFQAIANELRFGQNIKVAGDGKYVVLDSVTYGMEKKIFLKGDKAGKGKLQYSDDAEDQILSESAYSGLSISDLGFVLEDSGSITISLEVSGNKGKLWDGKLAVTPLNGPPETIN